MMEVLQILPDTIRSLIKNLPAATVDQVEEIRIRIDRPLEVTISDRPYYPSRRGERYIVTSRDALQFLNKLSDFSLYALEEELKRGYIAVRGGHRVGLAGKVIVEKGQVKAIKEIGSYNIRIAKQQ